MHPIYDNIRVDATTVWGLVKNYAHDVFWPKNTKIHQHEYFTNFGGQTQTLRKPGFSQLFVNIDQSQDWHHWKADIEGFPGNFGLKFQTMKISWAIKV